MNIRFKRAAQKEMLGGAAWYDQRRAGLGEELLREIDRYLDLIERLPQSFPRIETYQARKREIRRCVVGKFPFVIVYEIRRDEIVILAVAHGKRLPNYWKRR